MSLTGEEMKPYILLLPLDAITFAVLAFITLLVWRSGTPAGRKIGAFVAFVAIEVLVAMVSLPAIEHIVPFVTMRAIGRAIEIVGSIWFVIWWTSGRNGAAKKE